MKRLILCLCVSLCFFACPVEEEEEVQTNGIDFNVHYIRGYFTDVPPLMVISSKEELERYVSVTEKYTADYFANNFLVVVWLVEPSGSIRHEVESIDENGEIVIKRLVPKVGTGDIGHWNIIIELSNDVKIEKYKTTFVDVNL
jgi:hypothetical protein